MKTSNCCGAEPQGNGDNDTLDYGICPMCKEHCEYVDEDVAVPTAQPVSENIDKDVETLAEAHASKKYDRTSNKEIIMHEMALWLNRYDNFEAGYNAAQKDKNKNV